MIQVIKEKYMNYRIAKDTNKVSALSQVISKYQLFEISIKPKEPQKDDVVKIIEKVIKELEEEKKFMIQANKNIDDIQNQIEYLNTYLPVKLLESEIVEQLKLLQGKPIQEIMKYFKDNYSGRVDMGIVNKLVRELNG